MRPKWRTGWTELADWARGNRAPMLADRYGRRPGARGACLARSRRVLATPGRAEAAVPGPDQQLDLHPARPVGAAGPLGSLRAGGGDLDVGAGDRRLPRSSVARWVGIRHRRGGPDNGAARGRLHA